MKTLDELTTPEEQWYYFLKHADTSSNIEEVLAHHSEIQEAYEILNRHQWSENELQRYERVMMYIADAHGRLDAARNEGFQEGLQQGRLARKMFEQGFSIDQIVRLTDLSKEEKGNRDPKNTI